MASEPVIDTRASVVYKRSDKENPLDFAVNMLMRWAERRSSDET